MNNTSTRTRVSRGQLFRRWLLFVVLSVLGLQLYFVARVAMMRFVDPQSSAFERSQIVQILKTNQRFRWRQQWVPATRIHSSLGRAVIASEDDLFASHDGVQWQAIERAWTRNEKAQIRSISKGKAPKNGAKVCLVRKRLRSIIFQNLRPNSIPGNQRAWR